MEFFIDFVHLDRAIEAVKANEDKGKLISGTDICPIAQSARETYPEAWVTGDAVLHLESDDVFDYQGDEKVESIIAFFDARKYKTVRSMLPTRVTFTRRP